MLNEDKKKSKKDETEIGFTGKPIPKRKLSPKNRHEFEKKRREAGYTNKGPKYSSDVNPYYNPLSRLNNEVEHETNLVDQILDEVKSDGKVHNCKRGYYWCYEDKKCKKIPMGWHVGRGGYLAKDEEDSEETKPTNGNGESTGNGGSNGGSSNGGGGTNESVDILDANGKKFAEVIDLITVEDLIKESPSFEIKKKKDDDDEKPGMGPEIPKDKRYTSSPLTREIGRRMKKMRKELNLETFELEEKRDGKSAKSKGYSLRDWFRGGGWVQTGGKYDGKPCAKQPGQKTKPYCRDPDDRANMSKKERSKRAAKKRREDPNPNRKGAAKIVTQKNSFEPEKNLVDEGKKDACYHKVKARYSVWPSAYASGALVKCRKKGAKNWGNKTKKEEYSDWRSELSEKCWPGYEKKGMKTMFGKRYPNCVKKTKTRKEELEVCPVCGQDPCQCLEGNMTEAMRLNTKTGNVLMVVSYWRGKSYTSKLFFPQVKLPSKMEVTDEMQKIYPGCKVMYFRASDIKPGEALLTVLNKEEYELTEGKRERANDARRDEIAKKHNLDPNNPRDRRRLSSLMNRDTRQRNAEKKANDPLAPAYKPPTREKVKVKVGMKVPKPADNSGSDGERVRNKALKPNERKPKGRAKTVQQRSSYDEIKARIDAREARAAERKKTNEDWQKVNKGDKTDGMSKKAVAAYRRENPGSKLKTAVTGKVKKGSKDAKRRKSFCARSKGQQDMHNIDCSKTPDKPVCKARRRWKC